MTWSKRGVEVCPNLRNLALGLAGVGLLPACLGPLCPNSCSPDSAPTSVPWKRSSASLVTRQLKNARIGVVSSV